jgi:L-alanine-DL-glutamate epimerase-like enolase superfamily enzyme
MRIDVESLPLETKYPFRIARGDKQLCETFIFRVDFEGICGFGEASPQVYYGETRDTLLEAVDRLGGKIEGEPKALRENLLAGDLRGRLKEDASVRAAIDMALWDIEGKIEDKPCYQMLELDPAMTPVTSFTIGFDRPEVVDKKLDEAEAFPVLKMKMGIPGDLALLDRVIQRTGKKIRVDANEGWDLDTALHVSKELAERGIEFMEQPIPHHKHEELNTLKRLSPLHIILDESIVNPDDVERCKSQGHGINIKLMKCGGMTPAIELIKEARRLGLSVMLGCMIESSVGITAAAHLSPMVDYADLDGNLLIKNDPFDGVKVEQGKLMLPAGPGLGVVERSA